MTDTPSPPIACINARIIDPASERDEPGGVLIENGKIAEVSAKLRRNAPKGAHVIDCKDNILCPGLIDMQVATGEPGSEHRETLKTASRAATNGGVTTLIVTPETDPVIDDAALVDFVERRARDTATVHIHTMAAATKGLEGREMTELGLLLQAGAVAFSNGQTSVANAQLMRQILTYAKDFDALIVHATEDAHLASAGVMNEGEVSARLGLPGIPKEAETMVVERDLRLVQLTDARYHAAQISCSDSLDLISAAKLSGLNVTCGASINHLTLNESDVGQYRTFFKIRPPLRTEDDRVALVEGLRRGEIDVIVSNHDPQDVDEKRQPFSEAAYGAIGVETLLPAALRLFHSGDMELMPLLATMTCNPARLLKLDAGTLNEGAPADITVFDPNAPWVADEQSLHSRSKNSAFDEARLEGKVLHTIVAGIPRHPYVPQPTLQLV